MRDGVAGRIWADSHHLGTHARRQRCLAVPLRLHHGEERRQLRTEKPRSDTPPALRQLTVEKRGEKAD